MKLFFYDEKNSISQDEPLSVSAWISEWANEKSRLNHDEGKRIEQINFIIIRICGFNFLTFIQRKMNNSSVDGPNKSQYLNSILKYSVWNWKKKENSKDLCDF